MLVSMPKQSIKPADRWELRQPRYACDETATNASIVCVGTDGKIKHLLRLEAYPSKKALQSAEELVRAANAEVSGNKQ